MHILMYVDMTYIDEHIKKALGNYNALGTATFIVAYVSTVTLQTFWDKFVEHIKYHSYNMEIKQPIKELVHPNAVTRVATGIFSRDGFDFPVYFIVFKID